MIYRYKDIAGRTIYSDRPPNSDETSSSVDVIKNGVVVSSSPVNEDPYITSKGYIKDARKYIPKALVYVEYIEYLRKMQPNRYAEYLSDLAKNDPASYANLMKAGLFRPLKAHQRLGNLMDAGVLVGGDLFAGRSGYAGVLSYAEKRLTEQMKKDGFIPPDVLGSKASTLPEKVPQYSNTRLGQWSEAQAAQTASVSKQAQFAVAGRPLLGAGAKSATRAGGPVLDAMIGALDPQMVPGIAATFGFKKYKDELAKKGVFLNGEEELYLRNYLASGNWEAARNLVREAVLRSQK